ncbi:hypothetical protein ACP275_12G028500 [Erythranthe tilingii]
MADGVVSAVVETVLGVLSSSTLQEISLYLGLTDDLNNLESTFSTIQLVLKDAEIKQMKSEAIQNWLWKLKNASYDAEDVLDRIATEGLRRKADAERGTHYRLKSFLSSRNPLLFHSKMAHEVKNIRAKLDAIAEERLKFHLGESVVENRFGEAFESRITISVVNESEIYGRNEEKEMIIENLLCDTRDHIHRDDPSVYAVWGMGGLGKTTLAQVVYNDERIDKHFELRIWVCVSDDFRVEMIIRAILESIGGGGSDISTLDPLQRLLQERLRGRRFLLVLDDVWNENHRLWDGLKEILKCGSEGSVLMVTTRIEKVALMMANIGVHHIGYLSDDDSWALFSRRAFVSGEGEENFVAIGKVIVKKCGGVPLAIKALGSLMRFKSDESEWLAIEGSEIWHLSDDENGILPALRLSYDNLLPQMRQCFAYCCIFPKDYVMQENELVELWMANGYLPSDGLRDMYLSGRLIFQELVWRSFLQDAKIDYWGKMVCKMHDLMHDLASSVMRHETCILEHGKTVKSPKTLRHLSINLNPSWIFSKSTSEFKLPIDDSLRSIIVHGEAEILEAGKEGLSSIFSKQRCLRALDVNYCITKKLPDFVWKLEHLRYLVLSCYNIKRLPESLTCLQNLQTLKLTSSWMLLELPASLNEMKNLWFLDIEHFQSLVCTPPRLGNLTCLRRLSVFIVGPDELHGIDQLKELNLGEKLSIKGLEYVRNMEDAKSANLMTKKNLKSLSLSWTKGIQENSAEHFEEVLQGLEPHNNLETIRIESYQGSRFPNWMSTLAFKNMTEVTLANCQRCEHLPPLGKLHSLKSLYLHGMDSIKRLDARGPFPVLTSLTICKMPNFEEWTTTDSVESFPCLRNLDITVCPKLKGLPKLPALTSLSMLDVNLELVRSITFLTTSLTALSLYNSAGLDTFPEGLLQNHNALEDLQIGSLPIRTLSNVLDNLFALKDLSLDSCSNLHTLTKGLENLKSLETLDIRGCNSLTSFPAIILEDLPSLRSLSFQNCKKLQPLSGPLKRASNLQDLLINGIPELEYLPESMQILNKLRGLRISHCDGLCSLPNWLSSLESLSEITICSCKNLNALPVDFKNLKSTTRLDVRDCPKLEKRCKKPKGKDWQKISHIPVILINNKYIQHLDQNS